MTGTCPKCGAPRSGGTECPVCGVIYTKAKQFDYQPPRTERAKANPIQPATAPQPVRYAVDCAACKLEGGMVKKTLPKFPPFIRIIGYIIATPSAVGMAFALFMLFTTTNKDDTGVAAFICIAIFCTSAVFGLIGWLLLMRKRAWVCARCGYMMDRA